MKIGCLLVAALGLALTIAAAFAAEFLQYRSSGSQPPFGTQYPNWQAKKSGNPFNAVSVVRPDQQCYFDLDVADAPLDQFRQLQQKYIQGQGAKVLSADPFSYEFHTPDGKYNFLARTRGLDCGKKSYLATMTCLRDNYDQATADTIFGSMQCGAQADAKPAAPAIPQAATVPAATAKPQNSNKTGNKPLLGVVMTPGGEFNPQNVREAYRLGKQGGVQITHSYVLWTDIETRRGEREWRGTDYMMKLAGDHGFRLSVAFNIVHTAVRGPLPADIKFKGWDQRELIERFSDFVLAFLQRYPDLVDYVELGNEVNAYFVHHPDEIAPYREFFAAVSARIKQAFPAVKVGIVFAFHEMEASNDFSIYERLRAGDFDAFTLYVMSRGLRFERQPRELFESLQHVAKVTGTRQFAVEEVGWSASPSLGGSEATQLAAVDATFDFLEQAPDRLLFLTWFYLHDGRRQDCDRTAKTFVKPGDAMSQDANAMRQFSDYLCTLGLRTNDGKSRAAWDQWIRRAHAFESN
jgi:hypothetical protein